jgi:hypothetical protein
MALATMLSTPTRITTEKPKNAMTRCKWMASLLHAAIE